MNHWQTAVRSPRRITCSLLLSFIASGAWADPESGAQGWQNLLAGGDLSAWRNYRQETPSAGWQVKDGVLHCSGKRAGDLITREQYDNFELELEWRVETGGNSGIFFHATEDERYIFMSAPEVQILDDAHHKDGRSALTSAGANYGLHPAPRGVARSAGAWNRVRLRVIGDSVTQWLNGEQTVSYQLGSEDWQQRVDDSKFKRWPAYGQSRSGHIGLQDHGDPVAFRNIRIRKLESASAPTESMPDV